MIKSVKVFKHRDSITREYNVQQGFMFYSNNAPCSDLLKSAVATHFNCPPSDFWMVNQENDFSVYKGFEKTYLKTLYEQKQAKEHLFTDLQETFLHYQKGLKTFLHKADSVYLVANFRHYTSRGTDVPPPELYKLIQAFIYLQNYNHYPEYVKPIIYEYLGSKMLEG